MKKLLVCALTLLLVMCAVACGAPTADTPPENEGSGETTELYVFAAASMQKTLEEIATLYSDVAPDVDLVFNFESSGTLKTQIETGAECDIFISAGQKQMDELDITASADVNTAGLDFVATETRGDLLENLTVLAVPPGNPAGITGFDDWAAKLSGGDILMAMGNSDVPVGQYTQKILEYYNLDESALAAAGVISYGSNVTEVTTQVSAASVDCGVIYGTDAFSAGLETVGTATPEMCGRVIYPAALIKNSAQPEAAAEFLDYLKTDEAMTVFESVGFARP